MATANSNATTSTSSSPPSSSQQAAPNTIKSRFPRLQECAHFHYEVSTVDLPKNFKVVMLDASVSDPSSIANADLTTTNTHNKPNVNVNTTPANATSNASTSYNPSSPVEAHLFHLQVTANEKRWIIYRSYENFRYLDKYLHDCIFDRKFSCLEELASLPNDPKSSKKASTNIDLIKQLKTQLASYLTRFSEIAFVNPINCGPILNWFEIDNRGNRMLAIDDSPINIPGVAAAIVKKRYVAQSLDELSLDVGNMISVIDMPPSEESVWWRGKKELEVGFFPADCVELIKCNQMHLLSNQENLSKMSQNQSVRLKHGKLITLLRSFFNTRPARNHLQSKGIIKQRVFACDLGEHLSNTQQDVPKILSICTQFIEKHGIVDGIYRHTGLQSNIQKLRNAFDEEKFSEIEQEIYINDVHSVSSLLKMYFRELPNPLLTYQLYHKFIKSINVEDKIIEIHDVVQQLPPPHYRTLAFLMKHLHNLADFSGETNMNTKNLAIVWAPNLLKSREMDSKDSMQFDMLHSISLQANITEFLIANADTIFNDKFASLVRKTDIKNNIAKTYRPISICYNNGPAKLLSLEEAQDKYKQVGPSELPKYHTVIEIPDIKKKKPKEKDKDKKSSSNQQQSIPANIQIQQQFEMLQQHQLSKTPPSQLPSSLSSQSVVSQSAPSTTAANIMTASTISQPPLPSNASGSSSPAPFKSLFRNLRVGSLKHHSPNSNHHNFNNQQTTPINTGENSNNPSFSYKYNGEQSTSPVKMSRTASTSQTGATFKPVSSTLGITMPSSTDASSSTGIVKSELYSNCITQLQSTHNAMREAQNLTNFTGSLSPLTTTSTTIAPILVRTSKLNQSQTSIHSNFHINAPQKQMTMSTFSPSTSHTAANSDVKNGSESTTNQNPINPVPCKRRTTFQHGQNIPQSNSSVTLNQQQEQQSSSAGSIIIQETITKPVEVKRRGGAAVGFSLGGGGDHEYTDIVIDQQQSQQLSKQHQQQSPIAHQSRKSANEDDMQRLVAYINQFEQDSNSNIQATTIAAEPHLITLPGDKAPAVVTSTSSSPQAAPPIQDAAATVATPSSKLRLSSSSLSSSASDDDMGEDEDGEWLGESENEPKEATEPIKKVDNEYEELEIDHGSKKRRDDHLIKRDHVDRRTYIVNKLYDNLGDEENNKIDRIPQVFPMEENDDQYEKVIIDKNKPKSGLTSSVVVEDGEYDNDLIVSDLNLAEVDEKNVIMVVNRPSTDTGSNTLSSSGTNCISQDTEHIYMNVGGSGAVPSGGPNNPTQPSFPSNSAAIRDSLGFDVTAIVGDSMRENIYENGGNVASVEEEKFDSELVELNQQIKHLLNAPSSPPISDGNLILSDSSNQNTQTISTSNDLKKEDLTNKNEDIEVSVQKRKSGAAGIEELKRRRSVDQHEQQTNEETRFIPERTKTISIGIVPKTRQTISLATVETPAPTTTINSNPSFTKRNTNLKSTSNKSMSKSLQDNSKILKQTQQQAHINLTSSQTCQLDSNQSGGKLVLIETRNNKQPELEQEEPENPASSSKTVNVKSKIKLMESIVQNRTVTKSSERSSSTSSSTSSSSSSSSSSRSPPISPKNIHPVVVQPVVKTRTSHQKPMAPLPPSDVAVLNEKVKSSGEMSVSTEDEPTSSSTMADEDEASTNVPLSSLKEKRRTVKELMSKFEPK